MTGMNAMPDTGGLLRSLAGWIAALLLLGLTACGGGDEGEVGSGGGGSGNNPPSCTINTPIGDITIKAGDSINYTATVSDPDAGDVVTIYWIFPGGAPASSGAEDPGTVTYAAAGTFVTTLEASDNLGAACPLRSRTVTVRGGNPSSPGISINSTSQDSVGNNISVVLQQPQVTNTSYSVLAINDLGIHCGDLDTRVASILPPFQVLLALVIQKDASPTLNPSNVSLFYSSTYNPKDPIQGQTGALNGIRGDGGTYMTNFWDVIPLGAYDPFYPAHDR